MAMNKSVIRAVQVLEIVSKSDAMTLSEIAQAADMPLASASDILKALLHTQMIEIADKRSKTYRIGVNSFLVGNSYLSNTSVLEIAIPFVNDLSERVGNTVFLGKLIDTHIVYLHKCEPNSTLVSTCKIGSRANLSTTALGKVALAYNDDLIDLIIRNPLPKKTQASITAYDLLMQEIASVREQGYAIDRFEDNDKILCVGFPIFDSTGNVEHCVSISGADRNNKNLEKDVQMGKVCAREISIRLGYVF